MTRGSGLKICRVCFVEKTLDDFRLSNTKHPKRRSNCKECEQKYKKNPSYRAKQKAYIVDRRKDEVCRQKIVQQSKSYGITIRGRATRLWHAARHRAKIQQVEFTVTKQWIELVLLIGECQQTRVPFDLSSPKQGMNFNPWAPSIDKKNPFGGYTTNNIQIVCNAYNLAKNQFTDAEFLEFCKLVVKNNEK